MTQTKPTLQAKVQDVDFGPHKRSAKEALIVRPAFGLTLLAARVRDVGQPEAGYANYELPTNPGELAFTLKGALRLELANSGKDEYLRYRRLFGSISPPKQKGQDQRQQGKKANRKKDVPAWRSRVYVQAYANGAQAADAAQTMLGLLSGEASAGFLDRVRTVPTATVLLQVQDLYLDAGRTRLFSDLLRDFLAADSRLLAYVDQVRVVSTWKERAP